MEIEEILQLVREEMKKIPEHDIYFRLKQYKVKRFREPTVRILQCAIALQRLGLPVTTGFLVNVLHLPYESVLGICHALGDKHVLILKRQGTKAHVWVVHPAFMRWFEEHVSDSEKEVHEVEERNG